MLKNILQTKLLQFSIINWLLAIAFFSILYVLIVIRIGQGDPVQHAQILYLSIKNGTFPAQFIFYGLAYIIS